MEGNKELLIHVVCHTHDDPGWIWTLDDFYQGTDGCKKSVKKTLDNMLISLSNNKDRKFSYCEMAFFQPWYEAQSPSIQLQVKELVKEGRLEFVNGGYVMHDEASTHYHHLLDNMRLGLDFLQKEFDFTPRVGWFLDPFGHSSTNAHLMAMMDFKYLVLTRAHYQEKQYRKANHNMEFLYNPYGEKSIYTHISYDHYCPSPSLRYYPYDKKIVLSPEEIKSVTEKFYQEMLEQSNAYRHNNVLLYYGDDFCFNEIDINYENIEQIMTYVNENYKGKMKLIYSTPSQYFDYVSKAKPNVETVTQQDFFPLADSPHSYWTGYFSSRANLKGMIKQLGISIGACSKLLVEYCLKNSKSIRKEVVDEARKKIIYARERLGIMQHHDAITGTSKEKTNKDYEHMTMRGIEQMKTVIAMLYGVITKGNCISCLIGEDSLSKIKHGQLYHYDLLNWGGMIGNYQINVRMDNNQQEQISYEYTINTSEEKTIVGNSITFFDNENGLKYSSLQFNIPLDKSVLISNLSISRTSKEIKKINFNEQTHSILNVTKTITYDPKTGVFKKNDKSYNIDQAYYTSYDGINSTLRPQNSNPDGAYIFVPCEDTPIQCAIDLSRSFYQHTPQYTSIVYRYEHSYLIIIINSSTEALYTESIYDPIQNKNIGYNYLLNITSDIDNIHHEHQQTVFYTDSQGINMIERIKDIHTNYTYKKTENVSSNYYPLATSVSIKDKDEKDSLSVFTDRGEGASSMRKGGLELLVQRNSLKDDWKGVAEGLFENSSMNRFFPVKHIISFDMIDMSDYFTKTPMLMVTLEKGNQINANTDKIILGDNTIDVMFEITNNNEILMQVGNCYNDYYKYGENIKKFEVIFDKGQLTELSLNSTEPKHTGFDKIYFVLNRLDFKLFKLKI